jgi:cytochrome c
MKMNKNKVITLVPEGANSVDEGEVQWLKSRLRLIIKTEDVNPDSVKLNTTKIQAIKAYLEILKHQNNILAPEDTDDAEFCEMDLEGLDPVTIAAEIRKRLQA